MATPPDTIRAAVVGYGMAGAMLHAPLIAATEGMTVAAIVTGNPERRAQAQREHPDATLYDTADDLWVDAAVYDLAVIATANRAHAPLSVAALMAGLPVVVDKPMAADARDAEGIVGAAVAAGRMLTVFHNRRWDSDFLTARKLIDDGAIGTPIRLESRFERYRPAPKEGAWRELADPADAGGVLWDLGPHLIDQACVLFGDPTHVYAEVDVRRPGAQVDDDAFVALRFAEGRVAHLWMSATAALPGPRLKVSGLGGAYQQAELDVQEDALREGRRDPVQPPGVLVQGDAAPREVEPVPGAWGSFYEGVRDALVTNGDPPVDPVDGLRAVALIEAARRSAVSRSIVQLSA
jgi:scyllo-inositol 2-dehydrogenase (NADP+)